MSEIENREDGAGESDGKRRSLTAQERLLLLDLWQRSGLTARDFGALVGISRHTPFLWKQRFDREGPAGLSDQPRGVSLGSRLSEATQRAILMLKAGHPEWGCERIREVLLRGEGYAASPGAIAHVLRENGYELEEVETTPHAPAVQHFERARPNQLWQSDLFTFLLKRDNRRVYLVVYLDDHSRFVVGNGVWASAGGRWCAKCWRPRSRISARPRKCSPTMARSM
jgi:transposase